MALLARKENAEDEATLNTFGISAFDLVVVNLYPFAKDPSVELIDVGGPSMLRAAAKNHARITVLCDPQDYLVVQKEENTLALRKNLAAKVFAHVSAYDNMIARWLGNTIGASQIGAHGELVQELRYGENPQQKGFWYKDLSSREGLQDAQILQGKPLSYNNILDLTAAIECIREFTKAPTVVAVKHTNPCGVASGATLSEATAKCIAADKKSIFGGIVATNKPLDEDSVEQLSVLFLECVVAPEIDEKAKTKLKEKKNLRVLLWPNMMQAKSSLRQITVPGGYLVQDVDKVETEWSPSWQVIGETPTPKDKEDLLFAWKVCAHLKSNAIALAKNEQTVGLGMGQVNRVDAVEHAIYRWQRDHKNVETPVLASDAFFPFADSIQIMAEAGIRFLIQPGGSVRDEEVFQAVIKAGMGMIITGQRHFKH
jgi:phosphoribosylaminoimidazolecarboxamide formyltransferase/IMP cyclohydrolase